MADTRGLKILDAVAARLAVATVTVNGVVRTKPAGLNVYRFRTRSIQAESLPAIVVSWMEDLNPVRRATGVLDRTVRVAVEHIGKVTAGTAPDRATDALKSWAELALMSEETLGGLASQVTVQGTRPLSEEGEQAFFWTMTPFDIQYVTKDNDPEAAP